jgi:very-short-patch-repair endonuclease
VIHCDGAIPAARWAVEVDHVTWHGGRSNAQRDKSRDRQLRKIRWHVDRVTDIELHDDFAGTIREVVDLYHDRRRALAA